MVEFNMLCTEISGSSAERRIIYFHNDYISRQHDDIMCDYFGCGFNTLKLTNHP